MSLLGNLFTYFIINIFLFFIIYYILYNLSKRYKFLDHSNYRKIHTGEIPLIGGPLIYLTIFFMSLFFSYDFEPIFLYIFYVSFILILLGAYDDFYSVTPYVRIFIQIICCLFVLYFGLNINSIYYEDHVIDLNYFSYFFTLLCLLIIINAFNFIDGIDGLASSLFLIPLTVILLFSFSKSNINNFQLLIFFNVILFFLINLKLLPVNKIFLGDSGSTFLGFTLGCFLIYSSEQNILNSLLIPWMVAIPIFDLARVVIKRVYNKSNPLYPDNIHIHHILLNKFKNQRYTLVLIIFLNLLIFLFGLMFVYFIGEFSLIIYIMFFLLYFSFVK